MVSGTVCILRWWKAYHRQCGKVAVPPALLDIKCDLFLVSQVPPGYCYLIITLFSRGYVLKKTNISHDKKTKTFGSELIDLTNREFHCTKNEVLHLEFVHYMWPNPQFPGMEDLINGIVTGELHFLYKRSKNFWY